MDDVTKFLLAQGVLGAFVILETALIWYLLGEVKRLSTRLENVNTIASVCRTPGIGTGGLVYQGGCT